MTMHFDGTSIQSLHNIQLCGYRPAKGQHQLVAVGYNIPFLSFVLSLSSHIVGFIKELSSQLSFQLLISGNLPHGKLLQLQ